MNDRFTERVKKVLFLARDEAGRLQHDYIDTEHFLLGIVREREGIAAKALQNLGLSFEKIQQAIEKMVARSGGTLTIGEIPFTPRAKRVLELSVEEARRLGHKYIGTEHLLLGLIREGEGVAVRALFDCGVDRQQVTDEILRLLDARSRLDVLVNDRFTEQLKMVLSLARNEAVRLEHGYIGTEHFLLGLMREGNGVAAQALQNLGIAWEEIERKIEQAVAPLREQNPCSVGAMPVTPRAKRVLELAAEEANGLGHEHVGTEHLLLGLVREGEGVAARAVFDLGVDRQRVTDEILRLLGRLPSRHRADPDVFTEAMIRVLLRKRIVTEDELAQGLIDAMNRGPEERLAFRLDLRLYGRLRSEILLRILIRKGIVTQEEIDTELGRGE